MKDENFIRLRKPLNKTYWVDQMAATTINAQYWPDKNSVSKFYIIL